MTVERDWFWFWFYYALWLGSVFTLVLVLRQSSENRSMIKVFTHCHICPSFVQFLASKQIITKTWSTLQCFPITHAPSKRLFLSLETWVLWTSINCFYCFSPCSKTENNYFTQQAKNGKNEPHSQVLSPTHQETQVRSGFVSPRIWEITNKRFGGGVYLLSVRFVSAEHKVRVDGKCSHETTYLTLS